MKSFRRQFILTSIFLNGFLAACASSGNYWLEHNEFLIHEADAISAEMKDRWVAQMESKRDLGDRLFGADIEALVSGTVFIGVNHKGERVVLEFDGKEAKRPEFFETKLTVENIVAAQYTGDWRQLENRICLSVTDVDESGFGCYWIFKFEEEYIFVTAAKMQQYQRHEFRLKILGEFDPADNQRRYAEHNRPEGDIVGDEVGYNEICNEFYGIGANPEILKVYKDKYEQAPGYQKGYDKWKIFSGADYVYGLNRCDKSKKRLVDYYVKYLKQ